MKIEGNRPNADTGVQRLETAKPAKSGKNAGTSSAGQAGQDRVEVSAAGQLVHSALKAADSASAIRPEKVAAARQALSEGRIGNDTLKLADKLIDHMLGR